MMLSLMDTTVSLNRLLSSSGMPELSEVQSSQFAGYLELLLKWNARTNLTAIRDAEGIVSRHFVESIFCAHQLPEEIHSLLDFGSGGGFPGIPIAILRPDLEIVLAESQGKKAAFLQEVLRTIPLRAKVHARRAEELSERFDCVVMRAVDRMDEAVGVAAGLVRDGGWLCPMTSLGEMDAVKQASGTGFDWIEPIFLPGRENQVLLRGRMFHVEH